ncbi:hypothetical protein ACJJTC_005598 [Scirpophaga incertulas]
MSCVNDQVTSFTRCVLGLMDLHAPSKTRIFKHPPHPWITDTVKDMMRIRDDYHRQYRALRTSSMLNSYKDMKRLVSQAESKYTCWDSSPEREPSPPMPLVPPPPPPIIDDEDLAVEWPEDNNTNLTNLNCCNNQVESPYGLALFDYFTDHTEDLCFKANSKINLIRRVDADWLYGSLQSGAEGIFPSNYVDIKVPLPNDSIAAPSILGTANALFDFISTQPGDLKFLTGDKITVLYQLSPEWYYGECNGLKGQFPANYVEMC